MLDDMNPVFIGFAVVLGLTALLVHFGAGAVESGDRGTGTVMLGIVIVPLTSVGTVVVGLSILIALGFIEPGLSIVWVLLGLALGGLALGGWITRRIAGRIGPRRQDSQERDYDDRSPGE